MKVKLFFRKPRAGFRSIEELFRIIVNEEKSTQYEILEVPEKRISLTNILKNLKFAFANRGRVNHITGDVQYIALATGRNTVLTIHDCNSVLSGSWYKMVLIKLFWFWLPALMVKRITTISSASKKELERIIPFARKKIRVIPNPYNPALLEKQEDKVIKTSKPIILLLGTKSNKNLERTIEAMERLPYILHIIGELSIHQKDLLERYKIDYGSYFNLPYDEVTKLYHQCTAVCFTSTYEGFGMPIIEAQLVGKPVITSNIEPMTWVASEGGACFVDPNSIANIREGVLKVMENIGYRQQLIDAGRLNVQRFEPKKIAGMYEEVYDEIAKS